MAYVRLARNAAEVVVDVVNVRTEQPIKSTKISQADIDILGAEYYGYLAIGDRATTLYRALNKKQGVGKGGGGMGRGQILDDPQPADGQDLEDGNRFFAHLDQVSQMPTTWFGYQSADTVVLLTSKQQFATDLNSGKQDDPFAVRREALAEWVRRGGKLIISVSQNHQEVNQILEQMKIIDLTIEGRAQLPALPGVTRWVGSTALFRGLQPKGQPGPIVEIAKLKPGPGVQVLAYDRENAGPGAYPVIVQAPCGLGRVIVTAFDLNEPPFTTWRDGREAFWTRIKDLVEPANLDQAANNDPWGGRGGFNQNSPELTGKLVKSLENFPDVPVISFGWVALFILIYILIVGPLDYFFLKKVVKRLELTWITFPAVVIVISAVAYFAAYYLKGNDLRINKVDVVDVDLRGGHVYGSTWFTLFSPRIQNYTIGVEPATGWGPEETDPKKFSPLVGWMGRPEDTWNGGRGGSQGLFRRAYNYAPDLSKEYKDQPAGAGLLGVPIQVWSTKSFSASWFHVIREDELIEARITAAKDDPTKPSGTITSHLPVELRDVVFFYRNNYYPLENLIPGTPQRIDGKMGQKGNPQTWLSQGLAGQNLPAGNKKSSPYYNQDPAMPVGSYMKSILFYSNQANNVQQAGTRNSGLRSLDQKWRIEDTNSNELVVFGRAVPPQGKTNNGPAEEVSQGGLSASKLWLGKLPGTGKRDPLAGTLSQETYVRIYIPVK